MTARKTIRLLGVSLALVVLLVFATGVVSDWNHQGPSDDAHCPYCHLGHQTPAQLEVAPSVSLAESVRVLAVAGRRCSGYRAPSFRKPHPARHPPRKQKDLSLIHTMLR